MRGALLVSQERRYLLVTPCPPHINTAVCACGGEKHQLSLLGHKLNPDLSPFSLHRWHTTCHSSHLTCPGCGRHQRITRKHSAATQSLPPRHRLLLAQQGSCVGRQTLYLFILFGVETFFEAGRVKIKDMSSYLGMSQVLLGLDTVDTHTKSTIFSCTVQESPFS